MKLEKNVGEKPKDAELGSEKRMCADDMSLSLLTQNQVYRKI